MRVRHLQIGGEPHLPGLDVRVQAFLNRPLDFSRYPNVYLDATYLHGRDPARKQGISRAVLVAVDNRFAEA